MTSRSLPVLTTSNHHHRQHHSTSNDNFCSAATMPKLFVRMRRLLPMKPKKQNRGMVVSSHMGGGRWSRYNNIQVVGTETGAHGAGPLESELMLLAHGRKLIETQPSVSSSRRSTINIHERNSRRRLGHLTCNYGHDFIQYWQEGTAKLTLLVDRRFYLYIILFL